MFQLTQSLSGLPALEIDNASAELHSYLEGVLNANHMDDPAYHITCESGAFFQGGYNESEGWILIEFWNGKNAQKFIDYINKNAPVKK